MGIIQTTRAAQQKCGAELPVLRISPQYELGEETRESHFALNHATSHKRLSASFAETLRSRRRASRVDRKEG